MSKRVKSVNNSRDDSSGISMRHWSSIAIAGFSVFLAIILLLHVLHPEFMPTQRFISEYALGDYGWLLNIAILGNLIGSLALIQALYQAYPKPFRSWIVLVCLGVATISILTNFLPTDLHGKAITISGYIHNMGTFIGSLAGLGCMAVLSRRLNRFGFLQGWYRILRFLSIVAPIVFLTMLMLAKHLFGWIGLLQRLYAAMILLWFMITAYGIRSGALTPDRHASQCALTAQDF